MWDKLYWHARYWAGRFWPPFGEEETIPSPPPFKRRGRRFRNDDAYWAMRRHNDAVIELLLRAA
jgi:hypothetical protein